MTRTYTEVIEVRRGELEAVRGKYQEAKALTACRADGAAVLRMAKLLQSYRAGDAPEKAIYIIAQATMLATKMAEPFEIIEAFERKKAQLEESERNLGVTG